MLNMRKACMWSEQAIEARRFFSTPELEHIKQEIDLKIAHCFASGEGYNTTSIAFSVFACALLLVYSFEDECWILATIEIPPGGPQNANRKRGRRRNGYERVIDEAFADWAGALVAVVYNTGLWFCREIAVFAAEDRSAPRPCTVLRYANALARGRPSQSCEDLVQLSRIRSKAKLTFVGPLWTLEALATAGAGALWDPSLFGAPAEQVS